MAAVIQVVFGSLTSLLNPPLFAGITRAFEGSRHDLRIVAAAPDGRWVQGLLRRPPSGLVLVSVDLPATTLSRIAEASIPTVAVDTHGRELEGLSMIGATQRRGGQLAAHHLAMLGHREIAVLTGPRHLACSTLRLEGNLSALRAVRVEVRPQWVRELPFSPGAARDTCTELLTASHRPTAIIAGNDLHALDALEAAERLGITVPDELSIVGFDDQLLADAIFPALTTVRQPLRAMGQEAGRILRDVMAHGTMRRTSVDFLCELVIRNSSAPPRAQTA